MTLRNGLFSIVIAGFALVLMAPSDCGPSGTPGVGSMSADIDGSGWSAGNCNINEIGVEELVTVTGADAAGATMVCSLLSIDDTGTWDLASDDVPGANCSWTPEGSASESYGSISGTLEITTYDDEVVAGTFEFTGEDTAANTVEVTDGEFHCEWGINPLG